MRRLICILILFGCGPPENAGPTGDTTLELQQPEAALRVMTRNLYLGTDLLPVLAAPDLNALMVVVAQQYAIVQQTDFPARARRIADEIADTEPDLVSLQEVALWRTQTPADGPATPATHVAYDFLDILLVDLWTRGQLYLPAVVSTNTDVELTGLFPTGAMDVRFTDRDAILVRLEPRLRVTGTAAAHFSVNLTVNTVAGQFTSLRGWTDVDATFRGRPFRFVQTHLEAYADPIRDLQAQELLAGPGAYSGELILAADFNFDETSAPYTLYTTTGGLQDVWRTVHPGAPGYTCCQETDLRNPESLLNDRIDLVFIRGGIEPLWAVRVGQHPRDKTRSGLWPSDHAGVVAGLRL